MLARTAFNPAYFAQKSLAANILGCKPRQIESIEASGQYALILETGARYAIAIPLDELEFEHDEQRQARALDLEVEPIDGGFEVAGGDEPHWVFQGACDCYDWAKQTEANRPNPLCKHVAAVADLSDRRALLSMCQQQAQQAKSDLGW